METEMTTLANLKQNDTFTFAQAHEVFYLNGNNKVSYETDIYTEYLVLKKNINSVKCKPVEGNVEFTFKYRGVFNNYDPAVDSEIIITTRCINCGTKLITIKREFAGRFGGANPDCIVCPECEKH